MSTFESAGGARGLQKAGTNENLCAFSVKIDLGRQVDVPAVCDMFIRAGCVLLPY